MKKIIVGLVVGLSMVMANTVYGTNKGDAVVEANIAPALVLKVETPNVTWDLKVGPNERDKAIRVRVQSNVNYNIRVMGDGIRMREFIGTPTNNYLTGGRALQEPLVLKEDNTASIVNIGTTEASIPGCENLIHTPNDGILTQFDLSQEIGYGDKVLPAGRVYRIVLTFSAYHNALQ